MKTIPLTKGMVALVDDEDFEFLNQWKWTASCCDTHWYAARGFQEHYHKNRILMHRQLMGAVSGQQIDHQDRNSLNNQKSNLRFSSQSQNVANSNKSKANTSGFKGVTWYKRGQIWQAQLMVNGINHYLGRFDSAQEAANAYDTAAIRFFDSFAAPNKLLAAA